MRYTANADGIGVSLRAAANDCDLLVQIRERDAGTFTRVNCASKAAPGAQANPEVFPGAASRPPLALSSAAARMAERHAASAAKAEAMLEANRRRMAEVMQQYDRPVYPAPKPAAPPLVWPPWLIHMDGAGRKLNPVRVVVHSQPGLNSVFTITAPMTAIHEYYESLLNANGMRVHNARLSTGQTIEGVQQNAHGFVEGSHYPNGPGGPYTRVRVSFYRKYLNGPITVTLRVTTSPGR